MRNYVHQRQTKAEEDMEKYIKDHQLTGTDNVHKICQFPPQHKRFCSTIELLCSRICPNSFFIFEGGLLEGNKYYEPTVMGSAIGKSIIYTDEVMRVSLGVWLNQDVIDFILSFAMRNPDLRRSICLFRTGLYKHFLAQKQPIDMQGLFNSLGKYTDPFKCLYWIIPMNVGLIHWILAIVLSLSPNFQCNNTRVILYDSMGFGPDDGSKHKHADRISNLQRILKGLYRVSQPALSEDSEHWQMVQEYYDKVPFDNIDHCYRQGNGYDCGLFTAMHAIDFIKAVAAQKTFDCTGSSSDDMQVQYKEILCTLDDSKINQFTMHDFQLSVLKLMRVLALLDEDTSDECITDDVPHNPETYVLVTDERLKNNPHLKHSLKLIDIAYQSFYTPTDIADIRNKYKQLVYEKQLTNKVFKDHFRKLSNEDQYILMQARAHRKIPSITGRYGNKKTPKSAPEFILVQSPNKEDGYTFIKAGQDILNDSGTSSKPISDGSDGGTDHSGSITSGRITALKLTYHWIEKLFPYDPTNQDPNHFMIQKDRRDVCYNFAEGLDMHQKKIHIKQSKRKFLCPCANSQFRDATSGVQVTEDFPQCSHKKKMTYDAFLQHLKHRSMHDKDPLHTVIEQYMYYKTNQISKEDKKAIMDEYRELFQTNNNEVTTSRIDESKGNIGGSEAEEELSDKGEHDDKGDIPGGSNMNDNPANMELEEEEKESTNDLQEDQVTNDTNIPIEEEKEEGTLLDDSNEPMEEEKEELLSSEQNEELTMEEEQKKKATHVPKADYKVSDSA